MAKYRATGDAEVRASLILHCMPLIRYVVGKLISGTPNDLDRDDLVGSGVYGLIDAIERYDPQRRMKFESYAILRIRGAVLDELRAHDFNPRTVRRRVRHAEDIRKRLLARYNGTPAEKPLDELFGGDDTCDAQLVSFISIYDRAPGRSGDNCSQLLDELRDEDAGGAAEQAEHGEIVEALDHAVRDLPRYERLVITMRYHNGMMIKDISRLFQVTESRISQVHSRALRQLRSKLKAFV